MTNLCSQIECFSIVAPEKAPANVHVMITGPRSIAVSWTPLASDDKNGDEVQYIVEYSPSGDGNKPSQRRVDDKSGDRIVSRFFCVVGVRCL